MQNNEFNMLLMYKMNKKVIMLNYNIYQICKMRAKTSTTETDLPPNLSSLNTLFSSPNMSIEIAILYLHEHSSNPAALNIVLPAFANFDTQQLADWVPIIVHIYSKSKSHQIQTFLHQLACRCIPLYICIRWSLSAYVEGQDDLEKARNKLDTKFVNVLSMNNVSGRDPKDFKPNEIEQIIKKKEILSNYINVLNNFYSKLFRLPQKLKKAQQTQRKAQLHLYIGKLFHKFSQHQQTQYCTGICLPFCQTVNEVFNQSYLLVNFVLSESFAFSTKQRVPFKIVFETINFNDYDSIHQDVEQVRKIHTDFQAISNRSKNQDRVSLVLPHSYFGEDWGQNIKRIMIDSPYGHLSSYRIHSYIVKSGDDIRQQHMAMQLITLFHKIFTKQHLKLWVKPYQIIPYNKESGFIQFVDSTKTISSLKASSSQKSLRTIYKQIYGQNWESAITNFTRSLAGYSLFQYIFQVKDRHNNNILVDDMGHIIHIDFSFMISSSPGNLNFEKAPFKFTQDYMELMQGMQSDIFQHFKFLMITGFKYLRKYKKQIMGLLDILRDCTGMKCFAGFDRKGLERRFYQNSLDQQLDQIVDTLIKDSLNSYSTGNYDRYQWYTNLIHS